MDIKKVIISLLVSKFTRVNVGDVNLKVPIEIYGEIHTMEIKASNIVVYFSDKK